MTASSFSRWTSALAALVISLAVTPGCGTVRLISSYDETTDTALTELQQSTDDFIGQLIAHAPGESNSYANHRDFYQATDQRLRRLEFRTSSIPANERTVKQLEDVRSALLGSAECDPDGASLKDLHCNAGQSGPSRSALEASRRNINQTIGAALALELAKRTGD